MNVQPLNVANLAFFHTIEVVFSGHHTFSCSSGQGIPGYNGSAFNDTLKSVTIAGGQIDTLGTISKNGQTLDSLVILRNHFGLITFGHCTCDSESCLGYQYFLDSSFFHTTALPLLSFSSDSVVFGISGYATQNHVALIAEQGELFTGSCCDCKGSNTVIMCAYKATDWPSASLRVTLRR